jgi:hypothetical protein
MFLSLADHPTAHQRAFSAFAPQNYHATIPEIFGNKCSYLGWWVSHAYVNDLEWNCIFRCRVFTNEGLRSLFRMIRWVLALYVLGDMAEAESCAGLHGIRACNEVANLEGMGWFFKEGCGSM